MNPDSTVRVVESYKDGIEIFIVQKKVNPNYWMDVTYYYTKEGAIDHASRLSYDMKLVVWSN